MSDKTKTIRIGCASGFWGDSSVGAPQLVMHGNIDYLVFDYLAELTMSILAGARLKNPDAGYATDFVTVAMRSVLHEVARRGIRVVANAGGVNPRACAAALEALAREQGVSLRVAVVEGDDVLSQAAALRAAGITELQSRLPLPERLLSANAYLGALPIAAALAAGAQVVITGRCVDSAVTLGALMYEFGWSADDYDRLAGASLAGHIIECGCQATGGLHTDWESVPDWPNIGYPIVECHADGSFVVTKPPGTGGMVTPGTVGEQLLYEIGDPANYLLPDVVCDFRAVRMSQDGPDRVRVDNARGRAPSPTYKVSATYADGYRSSAQLTIIGIDAVKKAQRTGESLVERTRALFKAQGLADYSATRIEVLGSETAYGPHAHTAGIREAVLRVAAAHPQRAALELFAREIAPAGTSWSPGTTGASGRPGVSPTIKQFAFLLGKERFAPRVVFEGRELEVMIPAGGEPSAAPALEAVAAAEGTAGDRVEVPLIRIALGRSGDKGDISNIGLIARKPEYLPLLRAQVTAARVKDYLGYFVRGKVTRYDLPGLNAVNFVCEEALGGGGMASLRNDPLGKGMAQVLLGMPVRVPAAWL